MRYLVGIKNCRARLAMQAAAHCDEEILQEARRAG
jgi:hypothetical protein